MYADSCVLLLYLKASNALCGVKVTSTLNRKGVYILFAQQYENMMWRVHLIDKLHALTILLVITSIIVLWSNIIACPCKNKYDDKRIMFIDGCPDNSYTSWFTSLLYR